MKEIFKTKIKKIFACNKRIAAAVIIPLCAAVIVIGILLTLQSVQAALGDNWDLNNFTSGIIIRNANGDVIPEGGSVTVGESYNLSLSFNEDPNLQFVYRGTPPRLSYQLPANVVIPNQVNNAPIYGVGSPKPVIGHYNITTAGAVTVWFDNVKTNGMPAPCDFIDYYTNAAFTLDFSASFTGSGGEVSFDFGNNIIIEITPKPLEPYAAITKSSNGFDAANNTISYTVKVTAKDGPLTIDTFTDWARKTGGDGPQNLGTGPDYLRIASVEVDGVTVPPGNISWKPASSPPEFVIAFPGGKTLPENESMTVKYTFDLTDFIAANYSGGSTNYDFDVHNEASVVYDDSNGYPQKKSAVLDVNISKIFISKTGVFAADPLSVPASPHGIITWTVTIGDGIANLAGATVTDTLGNGFVAADRPATVHITLYDAGNNQLAGPVAVSTANGSGNAFSFIIPAGYGEAYYAKITIPVEVNTASNYPSSGDYSNSVSINLPGTPTAIGSVSILKSSAIGVNNMTKQMGFKDENTIKTTITLKIPKELGPSAEQPDGYLTYLSDYLMLNRSSGSQCNNVVNKPENIKIFFNGLEATEIEVIERTYNEGGNSYVYTVPGEPTYTVTTYNTEHNSMQVMFGFGDNYRWQENTRDTQIVITYETPLSAPYIGRGETNLIDGHPGNRIAYYANNSASYTVIPEDIANPTLGDFLKRYPKFETWNQVSFSYTSPNNPTTSQNLTSNVYIGWPIFKNQAPALEPDWMIPADGFTTSVPVTEGAQPVFDYEVVINPKYEATGSGSARRSVQRSLFQANGANSSAIFFDEFDSRLEYVPNSFKVITCLNYQNSISQAPSGSLNTYVYHEGYPASGLPTDVTVSPEGNKITANLNHLTAWNGSAWSGYTNWFAQEQVFIVRYQLRLKEGEKEKILEPIELGNTAGYIGNNANHSGSFTSGSKILYGKTPIEKELNVAQDSHIANFSITINPQGAKIDGGANLCVTDSMSSTLEFYLTSLEAFTETAPGSGVLTVPQPLLHQTAELEPDDQWSWAVTGENQITFVVPDETPVRIQYNALILGTPGEPVTISNYANVSGMYFSETSKTFTVSSTLGNGIGDSQEFLLLKNDKTNPGKLLQGTQFALYIGWALPNGWNNPYGGTTPPAPVGAGIPQTFDYDGYRYYYIGQDETGAGGSIRFSNSWLTLQSHNNGAKYLVREISTPSGYQTPADPNTVVDLFSSQATDYITVSNAPKTTNAVINGAKQIAGNPLSEPPAFEYTLTQVEDETGATVQWPLYKDTSKSTNGAGTFSYTISDLGPGTYYYMITENPGAALYWTYDQTVYIVRIVITANASGDPVASVEHRSRVGGGAWSTWSDNSSGCAAAFINTYYNPNLGFSFKKVNQSNTRALAGAQFKLYNYCEEADYPFNGSGPIKTASSNESGMVSFTGLAAGATYYMEESIYPAGYKTCAFPDAVYYKIVMAGDGVSFTIYSQSGTISHSNWEEITDKDDDIYLIRNYPIMELEKLWDGVPNPALDENAQFFLENKSTGAEYPFVFDADYGKFVIIGVPAGTYELYEICPAEYIPRCSGSWFAQAESKPEDPQGTRRYKYAADLTINADGSITGLNGATAWTVDNISLRAFEFKKKDFTSGDPITGAKFELYTVEYRAGETVEVEPDVQAEVNDFIPADANTSAGGVVRFAELIPTNFLQSDFPYYYMKEVAVVSGYQSNDAIYRISIAANGDYSIEVYTGDTIDTSLPVISICDNPSYCSSYLAFIDNGNWEALEIDGDDYVITNRLTGIPFSFVKTDQHGNPLSNVEFALYKCSDTSDHAHSPLPDESEGCCWGTAPLAVAASADDTGEVSFVELANGDYILVETKTKAGYQLPMGQWLIQIDANAEDKISITVWGEAMPPAFRVGEGGELYLPNYLKLVIPRAGSSTGLLFASGGTVLFGTAIFLLIYFISRNKRKRKA